MVENRKDQQAADSQTDQKNKDGKFNVNSQPGMKKSDQKSPQMEDEDEDEVEDTTNSRKEHDDKEHQHDYKTPTGEQNRQGDNQRSSSGEQNRQGDNQKTTQNKSQDGNSASRKNS